MAVQSQSQKPKSPGHAALDTHMHTSCGIENHNLSVCLELYETYLGPEVKQILSPIHFMMTTSFYSTALNSIAVTVSRPMQGHF